MNKQLLGSIKKGLVYAIIPARSGSKGIKNKNIRTLGGFPIISYAIAAATLAKSIDRVIVSTDSAEYAKIARDYGAETPFLRPAEIASDTATDFDFVRHAIEWLYENEKTLPEFFVHLRPTNPLRSVKIVESAVDKIKGMEQSSSLRSAHLTNYCPHKWFKIGGDGDYFETLFEGHTPDDANGPRQMFPDIYVPDGYVDILKTEYIVSDDRIHGDSVIAFCLPDSVDLDYQEDLLRLEELIQKRDNEIYLYLERTFKQ